MKYDVYEASSPTSKATSFSDVITDGLLNLADYIGIGTPIRNAINRHAAPTSIINTLASKINSKLANNEIELTELKNKLSNLETAGFNLSGTALEKISQARTNLRKKVKEKENSNVLDEFNASNMLNDLERAKDVSSAGRKYDSDEIIKRVEEAVK